MIFVELLEQLSIERQTVGGGLPQQKSLVSWIPILRFCLMGLCRQMGKRQRRYGERQLNFGYLKIKSCIGVHSEDCTYYVCT